MFQWRSGLGYDIDKSGLPCQIYFIKDIFAYHSATFIHQPMNQQTDILNCHWRKTYQTMTVKKKEAKTESYWLRPQKVQMVNQRTQAVTVATASRPDMSVKLDSRLHKRNKKRSLGRYNVSLSKCVELWTMCLLINFKVPITSRGLYSITQLV